MGLSSDLDPDARHRDGPDRPHDRGQAAPRQRPGDRLSAGLTAAFLLLTGQSAADPLRIATLNAKLARDEPGLLLRDILEAEAADIAASVDLIVRAAPDTLLVTGFNYDHGGAALGAFQDRRARAGHPLPHCSARPPNTGIPSGADLEGDGRRGRARDAQSYGLFPGQGGMAELSRYPMQGVRDITGLLWRDLPGTSMRAEDAGGDVQRLSSTAHWVVDVAVPGQAHLALMAVHATLPVFDRPEDRKGRRNHDEAALWLRYLDGAFGAPPGARFVLLGDANLDPVDGDGLAGALTTLLAHPKLQDPRPASPEGAARSRARGGANVRQRGEPALDTADWGMPLRATTTSGSTTCCHHMTGT